MQSDFPASRDLVLVGGGHTHALVLRAWGMRPLAGARVTVINPGATAPYSGMLPGFVAGHYGRDDLDIDLVKLGRFAGARVINGAVTDIDPVARTVTVPGRPPIGYDVLSLDVGITSEMPDLPGFADHAVPAKPLGLFATRWDTYRHGADTQACAVIGGGVAGAELAMAMSFALAGRIVHLIDRGRVLEALGKTARSKMMAALSANNVEIIENAEVIAVTAEGVSLADGRMIAAGFVTGAAGAKPHDWLTGIGLAVEGGFVRVDANLQSSDPAIFAVGDCAHLSASPRPKAGVFAVRQAPVLFDNLRAVLSGGALRPYRPQRDYLKLISLGNKSALAEKFGTARAGPALWRWKNHIDQKFMDQFRDLPSMSTPSLPRTRALGAVEALGAKPMCGGCGAKVGRAALRDVLGDLPPTDRADILAVPGDDAAMLQMGSTRQVISTDHLRGFTLDPVLMARIAAVHALGDVWAMGAKPQAALAQIILPRMSEALQARSLNEIMAAAHDVMAQAGAAVVGGHTSLGDELTLGFTVTGICDRDPITLMGAAPGDALVLTKPVGSGVVMAAEMAGRARGADVQAALAAMAQGQGKAAEFLRGARAMTDVTGFGLAGHLAGICEASGVGATVDLSAVPVMDGALALSEVGIKSTIFDANRAVPGVVTEGGPLSDLMFDPQTAGGLLAAVPADQAEETVGQLLRAGYGHAAVIGEIQAGTGVTLGG